MAQSTWWWCIDGHLVDDNLLGDDLVGDVWIAARHQLSRVWVDKHRLMVRVMRRVMGMNSTRSWLNLVPIGAGLFDDGDGRRVRKLLMKLVVRMYTCSSCCHWRRCLHHHHRLHHCMAMRQLAVLVN
ncbi:hypothetical protein TYRP_011250 [Tyrophagus putrescentiae]|nr:hypothetical protein TYRP_011250 [Tyrophagus putrescentiae]